MVGLGNVDNTSDANKPVSATAQTALDLRSKWLLNILQERFQELIKRWLDYKCG
jgi:hypothetical protein